MITVYSKLLEKETDARRLLKAYGYDLESDPYLISIPDILREKAKEDIQCPGCTCKNIIIVAGGVKNGCVVTQPHFRTKGKNTHAKNCSYLAQEKSESIIGEECYLTSAATGKTDFIARVITKAISEGLVNEEDFAAYREWSFQQLTLCNWEPLVLSYDKTRLFMDCWLATRTASLELDLAPRYAKRFQSQMAVRMICPDLVNEIGNIGIPAYEIYGITKGSLKRTYTNCQLFGVPDISHLSKHNLALQSLISSLPKLGYRKTSFSSTWLSTFLGVLLYANKWNIEICKDGLSKMRETIWPEIDESLNVIGTNLFDNITARFTIMYANNYHYLLNDIDDYELKHKGVMEAWNE
ncbi:MAG: hypothetical protein HRU20_30990 [Pseudomonadales bacterium]|nr:hypothetical protein [Pseudomonadales bacterium]